MREHHLRAALLAGLSVFALTSIEPAVAWNGDFWQPYNRKPQFADTDRSESRKKPKKKTDTAGEKKAEQHAATIPSGPLHIIVSIEKQRVTLFADGKPFANAPVSTGTASHPTPMGVFSVIQKNKHHVSNLYGAAMPYMQRLTWSGVAMHTGPLPGYAASHGCVRLPNEFAQMLWKATKLGARVVVTKPEVAVTEIDHPNLFLRRVGMAQSAPLKVAEVQQAMVRVASNAAPQSTVGAAPQLAAPLRLADGAKRVPGAVIGDNVQPVGSVGMVHRPQDETAAPADVAAAPEPETTPAPVVVAEPAKAAEPSVEITTSIKIIKDEPDAKKPETAKAPEPSRPAATAAAEFMPTAKAPKAAPISVFISRKEAKLYVRQGMEPLFDTPVTIKDADKPIGTHVFTAMNLKDDGAAMRWTVVSIPSTYRDAAKTDKNDKKASRHDKAAKAVAVVHTPEPNAKEALDRLDLAPETLARIETLMMPGSSLIVSDNKLSDETGKSTDFIILTR